MYIESIEMILSKRILYGASILTPKISAKFKKIREISKNDIHPQEKLTKLFFWGVGILASQSTRSVSIMYRN